VAEHIESQQRQYAPAEAAHWLGVALVTCSIQSRPLRLRPDRTFRCQKLAIAVCLGFASTVFCIEASRLARHRRDWHHLTDLYALVDTRVIDPDGTYDLRLANDRLVLGLKRTISEYELNPLRGRSIAAGDLKAPRGELRFVLPLGFC
jgi:DNA invertase Pin-like site-specific DNA recombinase